MMLLEQRISDRHILKLIRNWLKAGVLISGQRESTEIGSAQGGVISPLCANIYLNVLDTLWEKYGKSYGKLVRYADDCVCICKNKKNAYHAMNLMRRIVKKLELELHPKKTKIVCMWDGKEGFDFVYGDIADTRLFPTISKYRLGKISWDEFVKGISPYKHAIDKYNQLSVHAEYGVSCLKFKNARLGVMKYFTSVKIKALKVIL